MIKHRQLKITIITLLAIFSVLTLFAWYPEIPEQIWDLNNNYWFELLLKFKGYISGLYISLILCYYKLVT